MSNSDGGIGARKAGKSAGSPRDPADLVGSLLDEWRANGERWEVAARQARKLGLEVFNPALYAFDAYATFLRRYPPERGAILALGLNPGPYGMSQTGIPFTDCRTLTRELGIPLEIPGRAPKDLERRLRKPTGKWKGTYERSSIAIYRFLKLAWGDLGAAYRNWYVGNPCPLLFLDPAAWNVTPADPRLRRLASVADLSREALRRFHAKLRPRAVVCLGQDVANLLGADAAALVGEERVVRYPHPARAVPDAWARGLAAELKSRGLLGAAAL